MGFSTRGNYTTASEKTHERITRCLWLFLFALRDQLFPKTSTKNNNKRLFSHLLNFLKVDSKAEYIARHYQKVPKPAPRSVFLKSLAEKQREATISYEKQQSQQAAQNEDPLIENPTTSLLELKTNSKGKNKEGKENQIKLFQNRKEDKQDKKTKVNTSSSDKEEKAGKSRRFLSNKKNNLALPLRFAQGIAKEKGRAILDNNNNRTITTMEKNNNNSAVATESLSLGKQIEASAASSSVVEKNREVETPKTAAVAAASPSSSSSLNNNKNNNNNTAGEKAPKDKGEKNASNTTDDGDSAVVVQTKCHDWSLNYEAESEKRFWWNRTYSISIWESNMELEVNGKIVTVDPKTGRVPDEDVANATDNDVWRGYTKYQISSVYKVCPICKKPEQNVDCKICCYCSATVHVECSVKAEHENIIWKPSNKGFERHMCICFDCEDLKDMEPRAFRHTPDNARRACIRALASEKEYPPELRQKLISLCDELNEVYGHDGGKSASVPKEVDEKYLDAVRDIVASYFQPGDSSSLVVKKPIESKCGGLGVVAVKDIPRFTIIGVYPGYEDPLSGEQAKLGRPGPKYSLVDLNCADFFNNVFTEMDKTFTPFINEPNLQEQSNVAWIQENIKPEGRLSVMSVRDIKEGEELLIGYGPLYPRTYPYTYDAYAFHEVETHKNCFALWRWGSLEEKDATFVCYCGYDPETNKYSYWETEEEMIARKAREKSEATGGVGREGKPPKRQGRHSAN